jgi:murein L,D-transpeptidase YcbB/YkuD
MYKFLIVFVAFFLITTFAAGCGKKEPPQDVSMPMSINVESPTSNLITKTGAPVEVGSYTESTPSAAITAGATAYVAPSPEEIQQALKNAGPYTGAVDGKIGPMTKKAVVEFQQQNGLTADGKVGSKTWEKLKTYLNQNQQ